MLILDLQEKNILISRVEGQVKTHILCHLLSELRFKLKIMVKMATTKTLKRNMSVILSEMKMLTYLVHKNALQEMKKAL
jgi:hypothetical protein